MSKLNCARISFGYDHKMILTDLSFELPFGKTLAILGQSGCGKSTLLRLLGGFLKPSVGQVCVSDLDITSVLPEHREIISLLQTPLLFPHYNVFDNIGFGLKIRKLAPDAIKSKVDDMLLLVGLEGLGARMSNEISGGQKQRVAFARALILSPKILLLDEPFGSLDAGTRIKMQGFFNDIKTRINMTAVFVTHDLKEALTIGDLWGIMKNGQLTIFKDSVSFLKHQDSGGASEIKFWSQYIQSPNETI